MIGISELLTLRDEIVEDLGLTESPSDAVIARCRREAIDLVGKIPSATQEAAALFFVFSRVFVREYALVAVGAHLTMYEINVTDEDAAYLDLLAREIDDGLPFQDVLYWFESHIDRRRQ